MALYIQLNSDGNMTHLWDSPPPVPVGQDGWHEAVEVKPPLIEGRQEYGAPFTIDASEEPVKLIIPVVDISVEDRKERMIAATESEFRKFAEVLAKTPLLYGIEEINGNKSKLASNIDAINAATSHDRSEEHTSELQSH